MYDKISSVAKSTGDNGIIIRILIVDDDSTCLSIVAAMLKMFDYQVATASNPLEALSTLRMNPNYFDLVLSDVHMPYMSGLELHKLVDEEYHIPIILMSGDDKRSLVLEGLGNGAAFFIVKPPTHNDLKNLWQYVVSRKKGKNNIQLARHVPMRSSNSARVDELHNHPHSTSSLNEERLSLDKSKRKLREEDEEQIFEVRNFATNRKKPKLSWTTSLHNKFLEAVRVIGPSRAVPKKILECMNIPGLTRENIASHLQKYRIYLRRACEASGMSMRNGMPRDWNDNLFRSGFSLNQFPTLATNNYLLRPNTNTNMPLLINPPNFLNYHDQGLVNMPNNYIQQAPIMNNTTYNNNNNNNNNSQIMSHSRGVWGNHVPTYEPPNFLDGEIKILESSLVGEQSNISQINNNNNGNEIVNLSNQGDLGNAQVQLLSPNNTNNILSNVNHHEEQISITEINSSCVLETDFDGRNVLHQEALPVLRQNDPRQEVRNLDIHANKTPTHWQDWESKNLDEFSLEGIDDLTAFLSNYDANNGSNNA